MNPRSLITLSVQAAAAVTVTWTEHLEAFFRREMSAHCAPFVSDSELRFWGKTFRGGEWMVILRKA